MKTATANFQNRLLKTAEKSLFLAKVYYTASNFFLCSTERIKIGSDIYSPWVTRFDPIRMGGGEDVFLLPPNTISITFSRNSTTENLLGTYVKGEKVQIWQWFESLSSWSDALEAGTFIIDSIGEITQSSFTLYCKSDEKHFLKEIPEKLLNETDYPNMMEENKDVPWPMLLGDMRNPSGSDYRYLDAYRANVGISHCIDKKVYRFLTYRHVSINPQSGGIRAYEYLPVAGGLYTKIEYNPEVANWTAITGFYYRLADLKPYDGTDKGYARTLRLLPDFAAIDNTVPDWKNACDLDRDTKAHLVSAAGERVVKLKWQKQKYENIGSILPPTETYRFIAKFALNIDQLDSGGTITVTLVLDDFLSEVFTTTGYHVASGIVAGTVLLKDAFNAGYIKVEVDVGYNAQIDGLHAWIVYWVEEDILKIDRSAMKAPRRRELEFNRGQSLPPEKTEPESKISKIYVEGIGPADQSGQGWNSSHPLSILYFILNKMISVSSAEIDISGWNTIYGQMGSSWEFGISIADRINPKELLELCLREAQLKMWRNAYNKYTLFRVNTAGGSPNMTFSDKKGDAYLMKDFNWGYTDAFYNKFELKYRWGPGKNEFQELYLKDRSNDSDLQTSYTNYSNIESPFPFPEFEYVRSKDVMDLIYPLLKKYWKQLKIWIEFETSLVGCLLELGDTIQTNHSAQTWVQGNKNFQVIEIEQDNNKVRIKAIEVIP